MVQLKQLTILEVLNIDKSTKITWTKYANQRLLNVKQRIDALHDGMYTLGQVQTKEELSGLINSFED